jgi:hypothetical protein
MAKRVKVAPLPEPEPPPEVSEVHESEPNMKEYFAWVQESFEFQGVKFAWELEEEGQWYFRYEPVNPPAGYFRVIIGVTDDNSKYDATVSAAGSEQWPAHSILWGDGEASTPEDALRIAIESYAEALERKAQQLMQYAEMVRRRALPGVPWVDLPKSPEWDGNLGRDLE